jgi:tripartite-type tricarboxylate transporter receptor subunit TctC
MTLRTQALRFASAIGLLGVAFVAFPANAQEYPVKEITVVCPYDAGTGADVICRFFADRMKNYTNGRQVLVRNRAGQLSAIGAAEVAKSPADGYTMLITAGNSTMAGNPHLFKTLAYDPIKDFAPVTTLARLTFVLIVDQKSPHRTVADLTAATKVKGNKASYGYSNTFGVAAGELYKAIAGLQTVGVSYQGTPPALIDMLRGDIDYIFADSTFSTQQADKVRGLAVTATSRLSTMPTVPTMLEAGVPNYDLSAWWGAWMPAGTPEPIRARVEGWLNQVTPSAEAKEFLNRNGADPFVGTGKALGDMTGPEIKKWGDLIKAAKIEPQ